MAKQHTSARKALTSSFQGPKQKAASHTAVYMLKILITCWSGLVIMMMFLIVNVSKSIYICFMLYLFLLGTAIECSTRRLRLRYGTVSITSHYYGGIVTYMCFDGYVLTGPQNRRCSKNRIWEPRINPFCTGTKHG